MVAHIEHTRSGSCGTVQYPSLDCAGVWICEPDFDGRRLLAREQITHGIENCFDGGTMVMELGSDGLLEWQWQKDGERASARLGRPNE